MTNEPLTAATAARVPLLDRLGLPRTLIWGFVGLAIFMIGDGVETNILSPFLHEEHGFAIPEVGTLVTVYGVAVAIAAFVSAALSDLIGPRKVMIIGAATWIFFELIFLGLALTTSNTVLIYISYGLRGFGYPFFAYSFLVWISAVAKPNKLGMSIGWFYVAFSAGLPTLGALAASASLELFHFSFYQTLWLSLGLVVIGAVIALTGIKDTVGRKALVNNPEEVLGTLSFGLKLLLTNRKSLFVTLIRCINSVPTYGMAVFFPALFMDRLGWSESHFLILTTVIYAVNIPFNLVFGSLGDKIGWSKTVVWFGAVLCAVSMAAVYVVPVWAVDHNIPFAYGWTLIVGAVFGIGLAGFVPLSPIAVSLAPKHPGAAMASYNLGVGSAVFVGPLLVAVFYNLIGAAGMVYLFAALYLVAAAMTATLRGTQPGFDGVPAVREPAGSQA